MRLIAARAMCSLFFLFAAWAFGYSTQAWSPPLYQTHNPDSGAEDAVRQWFPSDAGIRGDVATPFTLYQLATSTAVTSPTAIVEGMKGPTTYTAQVAVPSGSLLDRLARNKPGIWGEKAFYVTLGIVYIVLLALFLRFVFRLARPSDRVRNDSM